MGKLASNYNKIIFTVALRYDFDNSKPLFIEMWCCFLLSVSSVCVNVHEKDMQSWYKRLSTSFTNTFLVDNTIGNNYYIYGDLLLFSTFYKRHDSLET